jgi:RNA polymerase sigma-70 factor (family 1)
LNIREFESLYKTHQPSLINYANFFLKSEQDAIDIVQELFISLWEKKESFQKPDHIKAYLLKSVRNRCINKLNRNIKSNESSELLDDLVFNEPTSQLNLEAKETETAIHKLIEKLPSKCKEIFILSRFEQLSYGEIANHLGISIKTVENQIGNAIKYIRKNQS